MDRTPPGSGAAGGAEDYGGYIRPLESVTVEKGAVK
jgi:hypothetical protein